MPEALIRTVEEVGWFDLVRSEVDMAKSQDYAHEYQEYQTDEVLRHLKDKGLI